MRWCPCCLMVLLASAPLFRGAAFGPREGPKDGLTADEKKFLDLTNEERARNKLPALRLNPVLAKVARTHSANMAKHEKMAHVLDGKNQFERIKGTGYRYRYAGENVARGTVPMQEIMQSLMDSKGHRENILDKHYTEIGVGLARDAKEILYYTQVFASPRPPPKDDE